MILRPRILLQPKHTLRDRPIESGGNGDLPSISRLTLFVGQTSIPPRSR